MNNSKIILGTLAFSVGIFFGQWSTFYAIHPERLRDEAYKLAGLSYRYGCARANGLKCEVHAYDFENGLRQQLPLDEIKD